MSRAKVKSYFIQTLATLIISNLCTLTGYIFAWPSYNVANFRSNSTVLSHPMTTLEISLVGSVVNIGALVATPFCTYFLNKLGRKYTCMLFGVPYAMSWAILSVSNYVPFVIVALALSGIGAAGVPASTIYISEISDDSIRGILTSNAISGYFLGLFLSYSWGGYLSYYNVVHLHLGLCVLYIIMVGSLKDSPVFLMQTNKEKEAAKSIAFYRCVDVTSKEVEIELANIRLQLDPRRENILEGKNDMTVTKELLKIKSEPAEAKSEWKFLINSPSSIRALTIAIITMTYTVLMGVVVLQVYAEPLFREAVPSMEPNQLTIYLAIDFIVGSLICGVLIDRLGRKYLLTITTVLTSICILLMATQLQFSWAPQWTTAGFMYAFSFFYNLGPATIPFVIAAEFFVPEVRGLCNCLINACTWLMNFVTLQLFSQLVDWVGLAPLFYLFSFFGFLGAVFCQFYLPETKGMPIEAIPLLFIKKDKRRHYNI